MFGFKGFENYQDQYQGKQVNRHDKSSYHQPNYYEYSLKNYNVRNVMDKSIMGQIPEDAKVEIIEYSKPVLSDFGE